MPNYAPLLRTWRPDIPGDRPLLRETSPGVFAPVIIDQDAPGDCCWCVARYCTGDAFARFYGRPSAVDFDAVYAFDNGAGGYTCLYFNPEDPTVSCKYRNSDKEVGDEAAVLDSCDDVLCVPGTGGVIEPVPVEPPPVEPPADEPVQCLDVDPETGCFAGLAVSYKVRFHVKSVAPGTPAECDVECTVTGYFLGSCFWLGSVIQDCPPETGVTFTVGLQLVIIDEDICYWLVGGDDFTARKYTGDDPIGGYVVDPILPPGLTITDVEVVPA